MYVLVERGAFVRYLAKEVCIRRTVEIMRKIREGVFGDVLSKRETQFPGLFWCDQHICVHVELLPELCDVYPQITRRTSKTAKREALSTFLGRLAEFNGIQYRLFEN